MRPVVRPAPSQGFMGPAGGVSASRALLSLPLALAAFALLLQLSNRRAEQTSLFLVHSSGLR